MAYISQALPRRAGLSWRQLEWWGAGLALLLQSDALIPLLMMGPDGDLGEPEKALLRLVALPPYMIAIVLLVRARGHALRALASNLPLLALMLLPFLSTLWSDSPSITLRRAIGLLLSMQLGYLLALRFTPRQLLLLTGAVVGLCLALSLALALAAPGLAFMPDGTGLRGAFTHKNGLGRMACLGVLLAAALLRDPDRRLHRGGLALIGPALACLALSQSATAMVSAALAVGLVGFYTLLGRLQGLARAVLILLALQLTAALLLWLDLYLVPFLDALGKDATLTGRVPLWAELDPDIGGRLWLGYGYEAFWTPGNFELWRIWEKIGWQAPNAHNGWRQTLLSLGLPGAALLGLAVARGLWQGGARHCAAPAEGWLWLNVLLGTNLLINLTESSLMLQNDMLWILVTAAMAMIALHRNADRPQQDRRPSTQN